MVENEKSVFSLFGGQVTGAHLLQGYVVFCRAKCHAKLAHSEGVGRGGEFSSSSGMSLVVRRIWEKAPVDELG